MASNIFQISNYRTITLYMKDYCNSTMKIAPLSTLGFDPQESVKVKILSNNGLDIARSNKTFVTDVHLDTNIKEFCDSIKPDQYGEIDTVKINSFGKDPYTRLDYSKECNWAVTARLRGYQLNFLYIAVMENRPFVVRPMNKSKLVPLMNWLFEWEEDEEDDTYLSDDSLLPQSERSDESSDNPYHIYDEMSSDDSLFSDSFDTSLRHYYDYYFYDDHERKRYYDSTIKALEEMRFRCGTLLVVEYNEGHESIVRHDISRVAESFVVDFFDAEDNRSCSIFTCSSTHTSAWDPKLHSDEGAYASGINKYWCDGQFHGIVLMGEQNRDDTVSYGMALYDKIIVPDLVIN